MRLYTIGENEKNQRLDKFLQKYLTKAPKSFLYKMIRKKNITLNNKRCEGSEKLQIGDKVRFWISEEILEEFTQKLKIESPISKIDISKEIKKEYSMQLKKFSTYIIYENKDILILNKPQGLLSQKASPQDISVNELLIDYLLQKGEMTERKLQTFKPSICNRLDRNTSGLLICGKSLQGLQVMGECIAKHSIQKEYLCIVVGESLESKIPFTKEYRYFKAWLYKDNKTNTVKVYQKEMPKAQYIETGYKILAIYQGLYLLQVHLITGKSHQIRGHLASLGYPILGDKKYGKHSINIKYKKKGVKAQFLHAYCLRMPLLVGMEEISERVFKTEIPERFLSLIQV